MWVKTTRGALINTDAIASISLIECGYAYGDHLDGFYDIVAILLHPHGIGDDEMTSSVNLARLNDRKRAEEAISKMFVRLWGSDNLLFAEEMTT